MMAVTARQLGTAGGDNGLLPRSSAWFFIASSRVTSGRRARSLVDKDNAPRWNPARIEDVTEEMIAAFFLDAWAGSTHPLADLEIEGSIVDPAAKVANQS
jgi:hypothetical protein